MNNEEFLTKNYDYYLPKELIATYPSSPKEKAKLLVYDRKKDNIVHSDFYHIFDFIPKNALIVLNNTKVIKARIYGNKQSGGKIELLYHREFKNEGFLVQIKGRVQVKSVLFFHQNYQCKIEKILENGYKIVNFFHDGKKLSVSEVFSMLEEIGHIPLPPYIKRADEKLDINEYQSVFAENYGAVAAPTASLHFSTLALRRLKKDFNHCFITLHIGAGTFVGVESEDIRNHDIHTERLIISKESMQKIDNSKEILCVGTTALRSVEYYSRLENILKNQDLYSECDIFLHPGNPVKKTNYLLTNFHLPKSSLIMLVSSMIGLKKCKEIYEIAIKNQYRFYSYGDGMLIL